MGPGKGVSLPLDAGINKAERGVIMVIVEKH